MKIITLWNIFSGYIIKLLFKNVEVKDYAIIGSSSGFGFTDNGRHLFLHAYNNNKKNTYFVTKSYKLYKQLNSAYPGQILYNYSFNGLKKILTAKYYFFTHNRGDILFAHNVNTKKVCVFHGMPIKCIGHDYKGKGLRRNSTITRLNNKYAVGFVSKDYYFSVSLAPFFSQFIATAWKNDSIRIMSYPRMNYLDDLIKSGQGVKKEGPQIILYMPTHRDYGHGTLNPLIFNNDPQTLGFLARHNYAVKYRFHPNMKPKLKELDNYDAIAPMLDQYADSQDALYNADVLISDYSSCVFDYLICERPIVFYHYDDYETSDNNIYYTVESLGLGPIAKTEEELGALLKKIASDEEYKQLLIDNIRKIKDKYVAPNGGWLDYDELI